MKKFLLHIAAFVACLIVLDLTIGLLSEFLIKHATTGETQRNEYICNHTSEDLLIMGSSRAVRHYNPEIISDSLNLSCYNCAYVGCGCITAYGLLRTITQHYSPKYILYEVTPDFDYLKVQEDHTKYIGALKNYYDVDGVDSIFINIDPSEQYKMQSKMYRINSKLLGIISENLSRGGSISNGFLPDNSTMTKEPVLPAPKQQLEYDDFKMKCFNNFVALCKEKNIKLVFAVSPLYKIDNSNEYDYCRGVANKNGIPFISHYNDTTLNRNMNYFADYEHMNLTGANIYTKSVIPELRELFK